MPEGPEIRCVADTLQEQVGGCVIDRIFFGLPLLKKWQSRLKGCRIEKIETHGKAMLTRLDNGLTIYSHNQLFGRWFFCDSNDYPQTKRQLRLAIDCQGKSALLYSASEIAVLDEAALLSHSFLSKLGPDVLDRAITAKHISKRFRSKKYNNRQLGGVLTDQSFIAGLGNYLRCEILFFCGLNPKARAKELGNEQLHLLAKSMLHLSQQSYQTAGITNNLSDAKKLMKQGASFEDARFYVFRREALPCYHCGTRIEKKVQAGQACYFCPACQLL